MTNVVITGRSPPYQIRFRYDADIVATIKATVPGYARSYDRVTKTWRVDEVRQLVAELARQGHHVSTPAATVPPAKPSEPDYDADAVAADLLGRIEPAYHGRVFRAMARRLYPDLYNTRRNASS